MFDFTVQSRVARRWVEAIAVAVYDSNAFYRRFLQSPLNDHLWERIRYFSPHEYHKEVSFVISLKGKIIAMAGVQVNPYEPDQLWVKYVSVDPEFQSLGYAKSLVMAVYKYALVKGLKVVPSGFTEQGQKLKHLFDQLDTQFPEAASGIPLRDF